MEDQPLRRSRRLQNLPPAITVEPPPPPQRQRLDTDSSFEPVGVSEVPGEPNLGLIRLIQPQYRLNICSLKSLKENLTPLLLA